MTVLTTELHPVTPNHFGQRYFGTDYVDWITDDIIIHVLFFVLQNFWFFITNLGYLVVSLYLQMAYALYRGTRLGEALQDALRELEEYEQISPSVKTAVLRKFDETICDKLENEVETSLTIRADRLWSFRWLSIMYTDGKCLDPSFDRFCDSVWQLLLKNVEFLSTSGQPVVRVDGKVMKRLKKIPFCVPYKCCSRSR